MNISNFCTKIDNFFLIFFGAWISVNPAICNNALLMTITIFLIFDVCAFLAFIRGDDLCKALKKCIIPYAGGLLAYVLWGLGDNDPLRISVIITMSIIWIFGAILFKHKFDKE